MSDSGDPSRRHVLAGTAAAELIRAPDGLVGFFWQPETWSRANHWDGPRQWTTPTTAHGLVVFDGVDWHSDFTAVPVGFGYVFTTSVAVGLGDIARELGWTWTSSQWRLDTGYAGFRRDDAEVFIADRFSREARGADGWMETGVSETGSWRPLPGDPPLELIGGEGADTLEGGSGDDLLRGGAGDDLILGAAGRDRAYGGDGGDTMLGGEGRDVMDGQRGHDSLSGEGGNDVLSGGSGDDTLRGGLGNNVLYGSDGNDRFLTGEANDVVVGGRGFDTLDLSASPASVRVHLGYGYASWSRDRVSGNTELREVEAVRGTGFADSIIGGAGDDVIEGFGGRDTLDGAAGRDRYVLGTADGEAPDIRFDAPGGDLLDLRAFGVAAEEVGWSVAGDGVVAVTVRTEVAARLLVAAPAELAGTEWFIV
jgi:Ca2+-binding RTX toxin-like protein